MNENLTQPSPDARAVLAAIADRLLNVRPTHNMDEPRRLAMVLTHATDRHGYMSDAADELEREVLAYAPPIEQPITRGEYSLILRKAAARGEGR